MLVELRFGSRFGEVHDMRPTEALAMLADGRARRPGDGTLPAPAVEAVAVATRTDRMEPASKRRRTR